MLTGKAVNSILLILTDHSSLPQVIISFLKRIIKYLIGTVYKPLLAKYLSSTRTYRYKSVRLIIPPQVFHPGFFFSTKLLLNYLGNQSLQKKTFLELGAGSGLIALYAAKQGAIVTATDINPVAVEYLEKNQQRNNVTLKIILSDLFTSIPVQPFDVIAINPPYFKKNPQSHAEYAWYCGIHGEYFERLFKSIGPYMYAQSQVLLILSSVCDMEMINRHAENSGWLLKPVLTRKNILEEMLLFRLESLSS